MSHSFTLEAPEGALFSALSTSCGIAQAFSPLDGEHPPQLKSFAAIWDTGATATVITQKVVDACGLQPTGMTMVRGVNSMGQSETYLVSIMLPHGVGFPQVKVTKGNLGDDLDVLIGMDIITQGDFSITNKGRSIFSFRVPSETRIDFVKESNEKQLKPKYNGLKNSSRVNRPKSFGKRKKK